MEKIGVLIWAHNAEKTLSRCVESVLIQSKEADEIWIIDDGSVDDTLKRALVLAENHSNIELLAQKFHGVAASRNRLLDETECEWIVFLRADEALKQNALEVMLKKAHRHDCLLVSQRSRASLECTLSGRHLFKTLIQDVQMNQLSGKLFHRSLFELLRFEERSACSEIGIMAQLFDAAKKVALCPRVMSHSAALVYDEDALVRQYDWIINRYPALFALCTKKLNQRKNINALPLMKTDF